jgi:hypothetical protein
MLFIISFQVEILFRFAPKRRLKYWASSVSHLQYITFVISTVNSSSRLMSTSELLWKLTFRSKINSNHLKILLALVIKVKWLGINTNVLSTYYKQLIYIPFPQWIPLNNTKVDSLLNRTDNPSITMSKRKGDSDSRLDIVTFYSKLRAWWIFNTLL